MTEVESWLVVHRQLWEQEKEAVERRKALEKLMAKSGVKVPMYVGEVVLPPGTKLPSYTMGPQMVLRKKGTYAPLKDIVQEMWDGMGYSVKGDPKGFENNVRSAISYSIREGQGVFVRHPSKRALIGLVDYSREPVDLMYERGRKRK